MFDKYLWNLLNRRPSRWGNVSIKSFEQDIIYLTSTIKKQQKEIEELKSRLELVREQRDVIKDILS